MGEERTTDTRLTQLELAVEAINRLPLRELALASSNCCNSCNNVVAELAREGAEISQAAQRQRGL